MVCSSNLLRYTDYLIILLGFTHIVVYCFVYLFFYCCVMCHWVNSLKYIT